MKTVFVSGFLNDHLRPFCDALAAASDFHFIATQDSASRNSQKKALSTDYLINAFEKAGQEAAENAVQNADVAIFGGSSDALLKLRKETGKPSFLYTERLFRRGSWQRLIPSTKKVFSERFMVKNENVFVLCAGSFVTKDLALLGFDTAKCFKFGYLPFSGEGAGEEDIREKTQTDVLELLYVGRLIKLKRVQDAVRSTAHLLRRGYNVRLSVLGDGPERANLEKLAARCGIADRVRFYGAQVPEKVYEFMKRSHLLFFASNKKEGWGAVVNEALSCACPVVVSDACGSARYLVQDGINGYIYHSGNVRDMTEKAAAILDRKKDESLYRNAQDTIRDLWNGQVAAERFLAVAENILGGNKPQRFTDGPMSPA